MKRLVVYAAAFGFLACLPASAQNNDHRGGKHDTTASETGRTAPTSGMRQNDKGHAVSPRNGRATTGDTQKRTFGTHQGTPTVKAPAKRFLPATGDVHPAMQGHRPAVKSQQMKSGYMGNTAGRQFDVKAMRRNMQAPRHFRGGSYRAPQGYQNRHWSYGERLPRGYYAHDYWIVNFMMYDLFAPPSYLIWVRVGNDALLIDRETGDIVQVRYGVFY
jgi:Ni/Co efflux regulator RcnB